MGSHFESPPRRWLDVRRAIVWFVLVFLIGVSALGNYFMTLALMDSFDYFTTYFGILAGAIVAQPCLLSIWCALGRQNIMVQVPLSMGILICLTTIYFKALETASLQLSLIFAIAFLVTTLCFLIIVPCLIYRKISNAAVRPIAEAPAEEDNQFRLGHLLITTAVFAAIVGITQGFFSGENQFYMTDRAAFRSQFLWSIRWLGPFALVAALNAIISFGAVFSPRSRVRFVIGLGLFVLLGPLVLSTARLLLLQTESSSDWYFNMYGFFGSLTFFNVAVMSFFFAMDFRLVRG